MRRHRVMQLSLLLLCFISISSSDTLSLSSKLAVELGGEGYGQWYWRDHAIRDWKRKCAQYTSLAKQARITGGTPAQPHMFPYQAGLLLLRGSRVYQCGGVLISQQHVLTAAHCMHRSTRGRVYLGLNDFDDKADSTAALVYNISRLDYHLHEQYLLSGGLLDDIALVNLPRPAKLSTNIQLLPLARTFMTQALLEGETVTSSGWGLTSDNGTEPNVRLYYVDAAVLSHERCACYYLPGLVWRRSHICVDGSDGRGSCDGDSGGPLIYYFKNTKYLVGLTAFGSAGGCEIGFPSVYTRITSYLQWISKRTGIPLN